MRHDSFARDGRCTCRAAHMSARLPILLGSLTLLSGCMSLPAERTASCENASPPTITYSNDGRTALAHLDVLTYNIEGLPWPARRNRTPFLDEIGRRLAAFRAEGKAPDIIVFQEVFTNAAARAIVATGYPSIASGPHRGSRQAHNLERDLPGRRRILKGEIRPNLKSSGLVIATDYPIVVANYAPFARGSCAGFDCLSNKGMLFAQIAIPGVPGTIDVFNTHMQSRRSSGVEPDRFHAAHARQTAELSAFARANGDLSTPTIIAGDFNMRNNVETRQYVFARKLPMESVHRFCQLRPDECEVLEDWTYEDQWRRVQNKHMFLSGDTVKIRPIQAKGMFDGGPSGPVLSDHYGFRVVYELSWPTKGAVPPPVCPIGPRAV